MARDGTPTRKSQPLGLLGPLTMLAASLAVVAIANVKNRPTTHATPEAQPGAKPPPAAITPATVAVETPSARPRRRLPRFVMGTLTGVLIGVTLGITAAVLTTVVAPELRAAVVVGAEVETPPPISDGVYVARVMVQAMNPNLTYADEDVAASLAPSLLPEPAPVIDKVEQRLEDNAPLVFGVLGALTLLSWAVLMWGLSSGPKLTEAAVE